MFDPCEEWAVLAAPAVFAFITFVLGVDAEVAEVVTNSISEIFPETQFRKLLPGQLYGQLVQSPKVQEDLSLDFDVYQVPSFQLVKNMNSTSDSKEEQFWFQSKFKAALLNTFIQVQHVQFNRLPSSLLRKEVETFVDAEIKRMDLG